MKHTSKFVLCLIIFFKSKIFYADIKPIFQWPAVNGLIINQYGSLDQKHQGSVRYIKQEIPFKIQKENSVYKVSFQEKNILEIIDSPRSTWSLIASIESPCSFLVKENGKFIKSDNFNHYRERVLEILRKNEKTFTTKSTQDALNFIKKPDFKQKTELVTKQNWYYLVESWEGKNFSQNTFWRSTENISLASFSNKKFEIIRTWKLAATQPYAYKDLVLLEFSEFIPQNQLPKLDSPIKVKGLKNLFAKFGKKSVQTTVQKCKYIKTITILTNPKNLLPIESIQTEEIFLPNTYHVSIERNQYVYTSKTKEKMKWIPKNSQ